MRFASKFSLVIWLCAAWPLVAAEHPLVVELWPGKVPEETGNIGPEKSHMSPKLDRKQVEVTGPTRLVTNVSRPTITIYRPVKGKETGTAILICPGGGYWDLYWQLEGEEVAAWLNSLGVTGIILKYRVPRRPDEPKGVPARRPLQDAQRAVSLVRSKAVEWGIAPERIGMVGFSAGGHLAIATATSFEKRSYEPIDDIDKISCRPDFAILAYPGYLKAKDRDELAPGLRVPAGTPPVFLAHGGDDIISPPEHSVVMYLALKRAGVPAELHIYATAAHDFGVRSSEHPCSTWTQSCATWLQHQGFLGGPIYGTAARDFGVRSSEHPSSAGTRSWAAYERYQGYEGYLNPASAQPAALPVKVSPNERYFVDQNDKPLFWLGTTQWQLFRGYTREDAKTILERTASHGFSFVQVMLMGVGDGTVPNVYGQKGWIGNNPRTPNEAYFKNVDAVVRTAADNNLVISMTLFHQRYRKWITVENARAWANWLAARYKDAPNIVWSMTPEAKPQFLPILRELAAGLREGDQRRHLITFKPDPAPYSSSFIHAEKWLDFNSMQTWNRVDLIYPFITKDYHLTPVKPVLMAEGAYEAGSEYGFPVTPLWVRRQAYYSYFAGATTPTGTTTVGASFPPGKRPWTRPGRCKWGSSRRSSWPETSGGCWSPTNPFLPRAGRRKARCCTWLPGIQAENGPWRIWATRPRSP